MQEQIKAVKLEGYKPYIFIDEWFANLKHCKAEFDQVKAEAAFLKVPVILSTNAQDLNSVRKAHVFRYGQIPITTIAAVLRKQGRIVASNLSTS